MATRTIVTSQPDVECDVCARRLLRGEQPNVFVGAGRRRIVCELCAPRAAHEGWMRETDNQSLTLPPMRPRRGRSLFERLRQVGRPPGAAPSRLAGAGQRPAAETPVAGSYDLFAEQAAVGAPAAGAASVSVAGSHAQPLAAVPHDAVAVDRGDAGEQLAYATAPETETPPTDTRVAAEPPSEYVQQAIAVFNASEFPRRVAGVTRSLGAPIVTVRSAEHLDSVVTIVVAWELCWYRYEVDLSEPVVEAQVITQGTELSELAREDRLANADAADSGMLLLAGV
jgi:hypothetical protein